MFASRHVARFTSRHIHAGRLPINWHPNVQVYVTFYCFQNFKNKVVAVATGIHLDDHTYSLVAWRDVTQTKVGQKTVTFAARWFCVVLERMRHRNWRSLCRWELATEFPLNVALSKIILFQNNLSVTSHLCHVASQVAGLGSRYVGYFLFF